jgi:hypothetical protein
VVRPLGEFRHDGADAAVVINEAIFNLGLGNGVAIYAASAVK